MAINNVVVTPNLGDEFDIGNLTPSKIRILLDEILYDNATSGLTATDAQAAIDELALAVSGVAHTSITGIDLKPTANPNEFTVEITWTDENGTAQTTTDPTPITIAQQTVVSADAGNLIAAGTDQGAFIDGPGLKTAVLDNVVDDCPVTDAFGVLLGTVLMEQP